MALLLHIDTATSTGSVCLAKDGKVLAQRTSTNQRDHAALILPFIEEIFKETGLERTALQGVCISSGPGSYTGLRVATSTAKGLCFTLQIPLLAVQTLLMMANGLRRKRILQPDENLCPLIDARRKEVYAAIYTPSLKGVMPPTPVILSETFTFPGNKKVLIFGTGMEKAKELLTQTTSIEFVDYQYEAADLVTLAEEKFAKKDFEDLAYFEPFYLKSVYLPSKKKS